MAGFHVVVAALAVGCSPNAASNAALLRQAAGHTWKVDPVSGITGGRDLCSVSLDAKGDVGFAVGDDGLVLRWNGREWMADTNAMTVAKGRPLRAVAVDSSGSRALAVGESGLIMSWDGKTWRHQPLAEELAKGRDLFALDFDDHGRTAWVVGQYGVALYWNGSKWTRTSTPFAKPGDAQGGAPVEIFGMWSVHIEPNGVEAIATGNGNRVLRWNGRNWKDDKQVPSFKFPGDAFTGMRSIALSKDGTKGWMVGSGSNTLIRSGSKWQKVPPPRGKANNDVDLISVACDGKGSTVFAVGQSGTIERWDGTQWSIDASRRNANEGGWLIDVALNESGTLGFAVGQRGIVHRWDGTAWKRDPAGERASYGQFSSVAMSADGKSGLAVGNDGTPLRWDGTSWKADPSSRPPGMTLNALWMSPKGNRAFGAGEDGVYEWNGSEWSARPSGRSIHAMAVSEDARLGFTGNVMGKIYRYDGSRWTQDEQGTRAAGGNGLWTMYLSPDGKTGFAGGSNLFLHWDGSNWHKDARLSQWSTYYDIRLSKSGNVGFAIGQGPNGDTLLRWNGKDWSLDPQGAKLFRDSGPYHLALSDDGQTGIAASFQGSVLYWDGTKWSRDNPASNLVLGQHPVSVSLAPTGRSGWILGWKGFLTSFLNERPSFQTHYLPTTQTYLAPWTGSCDDGFSVSTCISLNILTYFTKALSLMSLILM